MKIFVSHVLFADVGHPFIFDGLDKKQRQKQMQIPRFARDDTSLMDEKNISAVEVYEGDGAGGLAEEAGAEAFEFFY
jgi:hypothetical protein